MDLELTPGSGGAARHSLRAHFERVQILLRETPWNVPVISLELAQLRDRLEQRIAQESERYNNALAESPYLAPEVRELGEQARQLREAFEHLHHCWMHRLENAGDAWRREFEDFVLLMVEHEAQEGELRQQAAPPFRGDEIEDDLDVPDPLV